MLQKFLYEDSCLVAMASQTMLARMTFSITGTQNSHDGILCFRLKISVLFFLFLGIGYGASVIKMEPKQVCISMEKQGVSLYETWSMEFTKKGVFSKQDIHGFRVRQVHIFLSIFSSKKGYKIRGKSMEIVVNFSPAD